MFSIHRLIPSLLLCCGTLAVAGDDPHWQRIQLDSRFRAEGAAIADLNNDGKADIIAGDVWYSAPDWERHEIRQPGDFWAGDGYSNNFCNWTYDINGDGWEDVIIVGFPGDPFHWYENPKGKDGHWKEHVIWHSICNETPQFADINGDDRPEILLGSQPEAQLGYIEIPTGDAVYEKWAFTPVSRAGDPMANGTFKYYHGLGAGDVNGDGRTDIVIPHGWWEQPASASNTPWTFHSHVLGEDQPQKMADIHVQDLDGDGDADFIGSSAHAHGVWWFETTDNGIRQHLIDDSYSQTHAMHFVDVDGDGQQDIVTGKRYFAHNGRDPGGLDPVGMYWYRVERTEGQPPKFTRHEILAGRDTGVGTQFAVGDIDGDGLIDIALSNKKGVNILLQRR